MEDILDTLDEALVAGGRRGLHKEALDYCAEGVYSVWCDEKGLGWDDDIMI